ncbi:hypothetical protein [Streptomyces sp. MI02-7b]|uniref:hypothetical protein n=1 Tax=Streptomyces sp. MI02-7b TaxID=462941 RepID=UPI0029BADD16|nr:hypothetical protein [Streptomyces sp. MI02-7b]MDX3075145.1 hypothetical protein [Streptomyces sp. MI02-7b]
MTDTADTADRADRADAARTFGADDPVPDGDPAPEAVFRASCTECRASFELTAGDLRLAIGGSHRTTFYSFTCPDCGIPVRKPAGDRIVELLTDGGVRTMRLHLG